MNRIAIFTLAAFAAFSLAATSCQRDDNAPAPADRSVATEPRAEGKSGEDLGFAGLVPTLPESQTQAADGPGRFAGASSAENPGRFAGTFEFCRHEIASIRSMENPLSAQAMAGNRIVVAPGGGGRLRFSHIGALMADEGWEAFRGAGSAGWPSSLVAWLTSDGFSFSIGAGSKEIMNTGGHANGLAGLFSMRLWYEDEDTIIYEESRWRGLLWDDDAEPIEYRQITFRFVYRRIPAEPAPPAMPREGSAPAIPATVCAFSHSANTRSSATAKSGKMPAGTASGFS